METEEGYVGNLKISLLLKLLLFGTIFKYKLHPIQIKYRIVKRWIKSKFKTVELSRNEKEDGIKFSTIIKCHNLENLITALNLRLMMEEDMPLYISAEPRPDVMKWYSERQKLFYANKCKDLMGRLQTSYEGF